jgi:phosphonate transport system substrate-binding protein
MKTVSNRFAVAALFILGALLFVACEEKRPKINLEQPAAPVKPEKPADSRLPLHIAVGAMISPETTRAYYEDLVQLIAGKMNRRAEFAQRRTYAEVNDMVRKKEVDLAFVCAGPYTQGKKDFGMEMLVVPVANGKTVYHSYIIVGKSSSIVSMNDLRGKKFAFTDPQSNTGSLVPTYMLAKRGETPKSFFREIFYSNSHDNSIRAVANGQADGAAVDSLIWEFINRVDPELTGKTRIIEKSPPYGIPPVVVNADLDPATKKRLKEIFLTLHEDKSAAPLLAKLQIDRFVEGNDAMYDTVREMSRWLDKRAGK